MANGGASVRKHRSIWVTAAASSATTSEYTNVRLHSGIGYVTPKDRLERRASSIAMRTRPTRRAVLGCDGYGNDSHALPFPSPSSRWTSRPVCVMQ